MEKNDVDEVLCCMQGSSQETAIVRFRPLSMRMGVAGRSIVETDKGSELTEELKDRD